jgi:SOS-response transcriptional repressor LexA
MEKKAFADRFKKAVAHAGVDDTQEALGRLLGVSSVMIWSYKTGEKMPRMATAMRMAEKLGVSVSWLLSGKGSMAEDTESNISSAAAKGQFPLISWVQAGNWCEISDPYPPGDAEDWMTSPFAGSDRSYLLKVDGNSMYHPDGTGYSHGDIIHVDPNKQPVSGKDVIARTPDGRATFKRYIESQDGAYLEAINPAWPERIIKVPPGTVICGRVIGSWRER